MKKIVLLTAICFAVNSFGQINNVPASGQVSLGTGSPCAGKQLTVNGNTRMMGDNLVDGQMRIDGMTVMNGVVRMDSIASYAGLPEDFELVVRDDYGNVTRITRDFLVSALMQPIDYCGGGDVTNPSWFNGLNKLFSPCPQVNVGIGTSTPYFNLDVHGETFTVKLLVGNSLGTDSAMVNAYAYNHTQRLLQLGKKVGGLPEELRFIVNNDGSVEITNVGTNPAITINNGSGHAIVVKDDSGNKIVQLQNDGLLRSRSIRVDLGTWADHVFEKGYALRSLKATKMFIAKNGHLPDVPSAKEIKADGLDLGEMQRIQMQKIEELTLHLIQMDERMTEMEQKMSALEKENETLKAQIK